MKLNQIYIILFIYIIISFVNCNNNKNEDIKQLNVWSKSFVQSGYSYSIKQQPIIESSKSKDIYLLGINRDADYGIFTEDKVIKKGNELLKVKWTSTLNVDTIAVELEELFEKLIELQIAEEDILVVALMVYKYCLKDDSYDLKTWVESLPDDGQSLNSAIYFNDDELNYLKGSPAFVQIMIEKQTSKELFNKLSTSIFKDNLIVSNCKSTLDWNKFKWAYSTVSSRRIYVPNPESNKPSVVVVPYIDYFRRSNDPNANIEYDEERGTVDVRSIKDIAPHSEIFVNFDHHYCNSELLSDNGYIINEINSQSCVNVLIEELFETVNDNDPKKQEKLLIINKFFEEEGEAKMLRISSDSLTEDLLKVSQYAAYKQESVIEYLIRLVELKLSHYSTTIEQDKQFLKTPEYTQLTTRQKLAFDLSYQEKQILTGVEINLKSNIESSNKDNNNNNNNNNDNNNNNINNNNNNNNPDSKKVKDEL